MRIITLLILFSILGIAAYSQQNTDNKLALEYYRNKEFDKASVLYERLYKTSSSKYYFEQYINCLVELSDFKTAEKVVRKQIKRYEQDVSYYIELGHLYKTQGLETQAIEQFELALKKVKPSRAQIINLANSFVKRRESEYAEKVYLKGRKLMHGEYNFNMELAYVYYSQRSFQKMIDEYLDLLAIDDMFISTVQARLQNSVYGDVENNLTDMLKKSLLLRIQKQPDKVIFSELLIWQYIQDKDFEKAMIQAKALDLRLKEQGERLLALGRIAVKNGDFNVGVESFRYVIDQGAKSQYYIPAKNEYLSALYEKIINSDYKHSELTELEDQFLKALDDLGVSSNSFEMTMDLSHLQAFYLYKYEESIERLEKLLATPRLTKIQQASCKLELADVLLLSGEVYDATIYYAQVEKNNKTNLIGNEAQLKKARLAYYMGEFQWSQAQLDVLKASTSKLIANDAFELSQLISDNTALDTTEVPLQIFSRGDLLLFQNKDSLAILTYDSVTDIYASHSLADEILYRKAKIMQKRGRYEEAAAFLQSIIDNYSYDILGDDACFYLGLIYEKKLNNKEKAKELYKSLLLSYPGSIYVVDARKRFRLLRGETLEKDEQFFFDISP